MRHFIFIDNRGWAKVDIIAESEEAARKRLSILVRDSAGWFLQT